MTIREQLLLMMCTDHAMAKEMQVSLNVLHRTAGWFETPVTPEVNLNHIPPQYDELSSLFIENQSLDEALQVTLLFNQLFITQRTIPPGSHLALDLLWDALPLFTIEKSLMFSHTNARMKVRWHLLNIEDIKTFSLFPMFLVVNMHVVFATEGNCLRALFMDENEVPADMPSVLSKEQDNIYLPQLRKFDWVLAPEESPGTYQLSGHEIITSVSVWNPEKHPIALELRPLFRHSYLLQPGPNCFELFFQEFYPPSPHAFFLHGRPQLRIFVRVGQTCAPRVRTQEVFCLQASPMLVTSSGYVYRRLPNSIQFIDAVNEKSVAQHACLLALHRRIGRDSKLQVYFQHTPLHETMLFREIWDFLDDGR